jgi:putative FmdB family regulatory protein
MPIYEYVCSSCHHQLETMQSIKDPPLKQCPECKRRTLKKVVSATGFVLKGTGWYVTDFRDKGGAKKDKDTEKKADTDKAGEAKPAGEKADKDTKKAAAKDSGGKKPKGKASTG